MSDKAKTIITDMVDGVSDPSILFTVWPEWAKRMASADRRFFACSQMEVSATSVMHAPFVSIDFHVGESVLPPEGDPDRGDCEPGEMARLDLNVVQARQLGEALIRAAESME